MTWLSWSMSSEVTVTRMASFHVGDRVLYLQARITTGSGLCIWVRGMVLRVASSRRIPESNDNEWVRLESIHGGDAAGADESNSQELCDGGTRNRDFDRRMRLRSSHKWVRFSIGKRGVGRRRSWTDISHIRPCEMFCGSKDFNKRRGQQHGGQMQCTPMNPQKESSATVVFFVD
jgi:hypothetical protein